GGAPGPPRGVSPSRRNAGRTSRQLPLARASVAVVSSRVAIGRSSPAEQPLDIAELEFHVGRPAVIALAGIGRRLHLTQECIHLLALEAAPRGQPALARQA